MVHRFPLEVEKEVIVVPVEIDAYKKFIIFNMRIIKDNDLLYHWLNEKFWCTAIRGPLANFRAENANPVFSQELQVGSYVGSYVGS